MSRFFTCPYLGTDVELTEERERHIKLRHVTLSSALTVLVGRALSDPDAVAKREGRTAELGFIRFEPALPDVSAMSLLWCCQMSPTLVVR